MQGWISAFFATFTAYTITAYMAGAKLGTKQVTFISICYLAFASLCGLATYGTGSLMVGFNSEIIALNPSRTFMANPKIISVTSAICFVVMLGSTRFMWDIRHPKTE